MEWDLFHFKKLFESVVLSQPNSSVTICSIGLLLWMVRPTRRAGFLLILMGLIWLFVASLPITGYLLGRFLEQKAGPEIHGGDPRLRGITYIVVLDNVAAAVRIRNEMPTAKLVISGCQCAKEWVHTAQSLGVPIEDIVIEAEGRDTSEQAAELQSLLKTKPFILCTSALFSPRAVLNFKIRGMNPIPSPSDFMESPDSIISALQPSRHGWYLVNVALHEYVGLLWLEIREIGKSILSFAPWRRDSGGHRLRPFPFPDGHRHL